MKMRMMKIIDSCALIKQAYFFGFVISLPIIPPTAAPPTVPRALPSVSTLPATPPRTAPVPMPTCCRVGLVEHADKPVPNATTHISEISEREIMVPP